MDAPLAIFIDTNSVFMPALQHVVVITYRLVRRFPYYVWSLAPAARFHLGVLNVFGLGVQKVDSNAAYCHCTENHCELLGRIIARFREDYHARQNPHNHNDSLVDWYHFELIEEFHRAVEHMQLGGASNERKSNQEEAKADFI